MLGGGRDKYKDMFADGQRIVNIYYLLNYTALR